MTTDSDDPRHGVTIPAGVTVGEAAAHVRRWLLENTETAAARADFVFVLDTLLCDQDFTDGVIQALNTGKGGEL